MRRLLTSLACIRRTPISRELEIINPQRMMEAAALKAVSQSQQQATGLQREFQMENPNVSLEDTMIAMNKASISFGAAVQTRNKLVTAYEQIMNMPV